MSKVAHPSDGIDFPIMFKERIEFTCRSMFVVIAFDADDIRNVSRSIGDLGAEIISFADPLDAVQWIRSHVGRVACAILCPRVTSSTGYPFLLIGLREADAGLAVISLTDMNLKDFSDRARSLRPDIILDTKDLSVERFKRSILAAMDMRQVLFQRRR